MFCSSCGTECNDDAQFCSSCGKSISVETIKSESPESLEALKQYEQHVDGVTCLECGNNEMKGLVRGIYPWYASFWVLLIPWAIATIGWIREIFPWYSVTVVLVIGVMIRAAVAKRELHCTGCNQHIIA